MKHEEAMVLVEELRSGKYVQTKGYLKTNEGFCCLGVACVVAGEEFQNLSYDLWITIRSQMRSVLPKRVMEYFGFRNSDGSRIDQKKIIIDGEEYNSLTFANDQGCTFEQIADYIEQNWKDL